MPLPVSSYSAHAEGPARSMLHNPHPLPLLPRWSVRLARGKASGRAGHGRTPTPLHTVCRGQGRREGVPPPS